MIKFRLKEIMENKNLKISDLNEATGISRNSLSLLINGKSQGIQFDTLEKITNALNVDTDDLFVKTFNYLSIDIKERIIEDKEKIQEYKINKKPFDHFNEKRFEQNKKQVLVCSYKIDEEEFKYLIPYRIVIVFNPTPILRIELDLKDYDNRKHFFYLFNNFEFGFILFDYYITNKILEFEKDFVKKIKNEFNLHLGHIFLDNDLIEPSDYHVISITKKHLVNRQDINYALKNINESSLYEAKIENTLEIKSKKI